jgi:hypothetical protein
VLARGSNLTSATPTYYAASINRGYLDVALVKVLNGVETAIGPTVIITSWFSEKWAPVTLDVAGSTLRVKVQRLDSGPDYGPQKRGRT